MMANPCFRATVALNNWRNKFQDKKGLRNGRVLQNSEALSVAIIWIPLIICGFKIIHYFCKWSSIVGL